MASEIFQETIQSVLRGIHGAKNVSDDIICYGKTVQEHDNAVQAVLQRLADYGLTVNGSKCEFNKDSIEFFGLVFSKDGISPAGPKVEAIHNAEPPTNVTEVRSFLGMLNYSSRFIENFATLSEPLRRLTRSDIEWVWGNEQVKAFQLLKSQLTDKSIIAYFDPNKRIEILVDGSPVGLGAMLTQNDKVVAYASRSLTATESRYSQTEREALAIVWACEHFNMYLSGAPEFLIITDHKPLEKIWEKPRPPLRIERWGLRLQPYKYKIEYRPGRDNPADYMSRHPNTKCTVKSQEQDIAEQYVNYVTVNAIPQAIRLTDVREATQSDKTLQMVIELSRTNRWHDAKLCNDEDIDLAEVQEFHKVRDQLTCQIDGILLKHDKVVMPSALREQAVALAHEGHQGMARTKGLIRSKVWFPRINEMVESRVNRCHACQTVTKRKQRLEPLQMSDLPAGPRQHYSLDFMGPLPSGDYLLVMVDEYSRFPIVEIIRSTSSNTVIPVLDKIFSVFGYPKVVKTDNGSPFTSYAFADFVRHSGFKHRRITPLWPRSNAQAESFNKPLEKLIRAAHIESKNWKQEMFSFLRQYRATPHPSTGFAPHRLMFDEEPRTKLPQLDGKAHTLDPLVRDRDTLAKNKQKYYADRQNNAENKNLKCGDSVLVRNDKRGDKLSTVFKPKPHIITSTKGTMITATSGDGHITRNASHFLKVPFRPDLYVDDDESDLEMKDAGGRNNNGFIPHEMIVPQDCPSDNIVSQNEDACQSKESVDTKYCDRQKKSVTLTRRPDSEKAHVSPSKDLLVSERPKRQRKMPNYLKDYSV